MPDPALQRIQDWLTRRGQLVEMMAAEKNRAQQAKGAVRRDIDLHIAWLKKRIRDTERDLKELLEGFPQWDARVDLLDEQKGIGRVTAMTLVAIVPELGTLSRKKIAKLVGVAPLDNDSGDRKGKRSIWGGRAAARACLYMATLVAVRWNPSLRSFYERLVGRGSPRRSPWSPP